MMLILLFLPLKMLAQDITGAWSGYLETNGTQIPFELVIGEKNYFITGYSLTSFSIKGVENIGIKSIRFSERDSTVLIEDDTMVYNNYTTTSRRVKFFATLSILVQDTITWLSGSFKTRSMDFRARDNNNFSGKIYLQKQHYPPKTKLANKLDELNLLTALTIHPDPDKNNIGIVSAPPDPKKKMVESKTESVNDSSGNAIVQNSSISGDRPQLINRDAPLPPDPKKKTVSVKASATKDSSSAAVAQQNGISGNRPQLINKPAPDIPVKKAAADIATRKKDVIRTVPFTSDSLVLSLFDNGIVDGDTVSVVLNDKVIIANLGLLSKAKRFVIPVTEDMGDTLLLTMYAENLGTIPPNTGVLYLQDGETRYEVRFTGDLKTSSAIMLKRERKKK